jgi:hypothetical protein
VHVDIVLHALQAGVIVQGVLRRCRHGTPLGHRGAVGFPRARS